MSTIEIYDQSLKVRSKNIGSLVKKALLNENGKRSRILYAGPHPLEYNSMVVFRLVELLKGRYFLEETIVNSGLKSMTTNLTSLHHQEFHRIKTPGEIMHQRDFHPNPEIISAVSYTRELTYSKKVFNSIIIDDIRHKKSFFDCKIKWQINRYLSNKI